MLILGVYLHLSAERLKGPLHKALPFSAYGKINIHFNIPSIDVVDLHSDNLLMKDLIIICKN